MIRNLKQLVQGGVIVAGIVDHRQRRLVGELLRPHEILPPDLHLVDPHLARRLVDHPLQLEGPLGAPGAAIGVDRHGVGEHPLHVHIGERRPVRPARGRPVQVGGRHRREEPQVGAEVGMGLGAERQEHAVRVQRQLDPGHMVPPLRVGDEGLGAARRPLHRTPQHLRGAGDERLLAVVHDLRAEPPADVRRDHPQLSLGNVQDEGAHHQPDDVRVLAGGEEGVLVRPGVVLRHRAARLHRVRHAAVVDELERGHVMRRLEGGVHRRLVRLEKAPVEAEVRGQALVHLGRARRQRRLHVQDGRKLLDVELDRLGGVTRLGIGLGHHPGDGFADVAHHPFGEDRVARLLLRRAVAADRRPGAGQASGVAEIVAGEHPEHPGHRRRLRGVEPGDPPVRHVRAQEVHVGLPGAVDVVGVPALAGQEANVLAALQRRADPVILGHDVLPAPIPPRPGPAPARWPPPGSP